MLTTNLRDPNKNVSRQIRFTKLSAVFRLNTPTTFTGTLDPSSTPFFDRIAPGWGVIARDDGVQFGGDLTKIHRKNDKGIPTWELTGVGDCRFSQTGLHTLTRLNVRTNKMYRIIVIKPRRG